MLDKPYRRDNSLGMLSGKIHFLLKKELQRQLEKREIPLNVKYFPVINKLLDEDRVTQQVISEWIGFDRPRTSRMIDELEKVKLVVREDDPTSRRTKLICLTEHMKKNKYKIVDALEESLDRAFTGFKNSERNKMIENLKRIKTNLE